MSENTPSVKTGSLAPLKNVAGFMALTKKIQERGPHLPNLGVMHGRSGEGKTYASIYVQNRTRAIRVEVGASWNRKTFVRSILLECGVVDPRGATADLVERAIALLGDQPDRPLIVDEADKLVDKGLIEIVREIAEASQVPVLLIGEEQLPQKLERVERVHNRVLEWYGAEPSDLADCKLLAKIFLPGVEIADDLLESVRIKGGGRARRIVVTLSGMADWCRNSGAKAIDLKSYTGGIFTGEAPKPRALRVGRAA